MLKKVTSLVLAGVMALSLAACGGNGGNGGTPSAEPTPAPLSINLTEFYEEMFNTVFPDPDNSPSMMALEGDMLAQAYPGLADIETKQCLVYAPMITAVAYEIALVEVADAADVQAVKDIFQARIDTQIESGAFYPATVEAWQNQSHIVDRENYVALFVGEGSDQMVELFNAAGAADAGEAASETPAE